MTCQRIDAHPLGSCPDYTSPEERATGGSFPADHCARCGATGSTPHWVRCPNRRKVTRCDCGLRAYHDGPCMLEETR